MQRAFVAREIGQTFQIFGKTKFSSVPAEIGDMAGDRLICAPQTYTQLGGSGGLVVPMLLLFRDPPAVPIGPSLAPGRRPGLQKETP